MPPDTLRTADGGLIRTWRGEVSAADQLRAVDDLATPGFFADARFVIVDYRQVTRYDLSPDQIRAVAERMRHLQMPGLVVLIARRDALFGMARMWELIVGESPALTTRVVRTAADAIAFIEAELGVRLDDTRSVLHDDALA